MLDIKRVRSDPDGVRLALTNRGGRFLPKFEELLTLDGALRAVQAEVEPLRARRNQAAEEIGRLKREKKDAAPLLKEMEELKERMKTLETRAAESDAAVQAALLELPNIPLGTVPPGRGAEDNREVRRWGTPRSFGFKPKDHQELGEKLGMMDFARAAKISGSAICVVDGRGRPAGTGVD
jgi:seryl-tRNA synthetase